MPVFEITAPDGRKFRVTAPDGASREEALSKVQAQYKPKTKLEPLNVDPTEGMSTTEKFLAGAGKGMTDVARGIGQVVGAVSREDMDEVRKRDAALSNTGAGAVGEVVGNLAATAPAMLIPGGQTVAGSAAIGATQGLLAPVATGESRLNNAAFGSGGGAVGAVVPKVLARVAQPIKQSGAVKNLLSEGVTPTPGQSAGGFLNRIEQQLESIPVIGQFITHARGRAVKEMDEAAIRKALPPGTVETIKAGREGIERAGALIDNAYDAAYQQITKPVKVDTEFYKQISSIPSKEGIDLPPSLAKRFDALVKDRVMARLSESSDAEAIRTAHNSLGALSRKYMGSPDPDQRALGQAFKEAKLKLREMVSRQSAGDFKTTLDALDNKNAALKAVEKASGYQGSKEGVFSAEALKRASTKSSGEMRKFASEAADVLGRTVPDSGTAGRMLIPLAGAAAAGGNEYAGGPGWLTGLAAAPLLYSRMGSRYAVGGYPAQATIAEIIRSTAPYTSQLGRSIGSQ